MKYILLACIRIYQHFISPFKGFRCAHHQLHKTGSCSSFVANIISEKGAYKGWSHISERFKACRAAHLVLNERYPSGDLPCDIACSPDLPSGCSGGDAGGSSCSHGSSCVLDCIDLSRSMSRRFRIVLTVLIILLFIFLSYWFYGRGVSHVYLIDHGVTDHSLLNRLVHRENPTIRVLLIESGNKYYSEIIKLESELREHKLPMADAPLGEIEQLTVFDARVNVGDKALVLGQVLEEFKSPLNKGQGKRFSYRIKRRWHW